MLLVVFLASLAVSAYGLAMTRKWALWLSYVQSPLRWWYRTAVFWLPPVLYGLDGLLPYETFEWIQLGTLFVLNFRRLAVTIAIHLQLRGKRLQLVAVPPKAHGPPKPEEPAVEAGRGTLTNEE